MSQGTYHQDTYSYAMLSRDSPGVSVWIPLADIDADTDGGSVWLVDMSKVSAGCQRAPPETDVFSAECEAEFDKVRVAPNWRKGDVLLFSKDVVHKTQPLLPTAKLSARFSLVGRFTTNEARCNLKGGNPGIKLKFTHCNHGLAHGEPIASPCYPQLYPRVLQEEKAVRDLGKLGIPCNSVWFAKEIWGVITSGGEWY